MPNRLQEGTKEEVTGMTGLRIDHRGVKLPAPTAELIEDVAKVAFRTFIDMHRLIDSPSGKLKDIGWLELAEPRQDVWRGISRRAYAEIARAAGATIIEMPEE